MSYFQKTFFSSKLKKLAERESIIAIRVSIIKLYMPRWLIDPVNPDQKTFRPEYQSALMGCFIYIQDSSNSSLLTFELVSSVLALEATEPVSEPVTQLAAVDLIKVGNFWFLYPLVLSK